MFTINGGESIMWGVKCNHPHEESKIYLRGTLMTCWSFLAAFYNDVINRHKFR